MKTHRQKLAPLVAGCCAAGFAAAPAAADIFSPSQSDLLGLVDVTVDFGGGGELFSIDPHPNAAAFPDAVQLDMDFLPGTVVEGDPLSRIALENTSFQMDLSGFDSFDVLFQTEDLQALDIALFVRSADPVSGDEFFFQGSIVRSTLSAFEPVRVSANLANVQFADNVTGFGVQIFEPNTANSVANRARLQPAGEPVVLETSRVIGSFEAPTFPVGGDNPTGWTFIADLPGPTESDTSFELTTLGATDGGQALKIKRAGATGNTFQWGLQRLWTVDPEADGRPVPADADNDAPNDTAVPILSQPEMDQIIADLNGATALALDVTWDPADFDEGVTFAQLHFAIGVGGGWFQVDNLAQVNPGDLTEPTTISLQVPLGQFVDVTDSDLGNLLEFEVPADEQTISFNIATNLTAGLEGAAIIDNLRLLTVADDEPLVGDLNGDGFVGAGDLDILLGVWNQDVTDNVADLNDDGFIGAGDLDILLGNWNAGTPPTGSADVVPEPASLALVAAGLLGLGRRRRVA